jgi:hypothetical protein
MGTTEQPLQQRVGDHEIVMRRVRDYERTTDTEGGPERPSSDAFIQGGPDGDTSVSIKSETSPEHLLRGYPNTYLAELEVRVIRSLELEVERDPKKENRGHCNIKGRKTRSKAQRLAKSSRWVPGYGPSQPRVPNTPS